ncbi:phosphoglycerate mutase family protein-like protein [Massariosphaeria phaeospora]|uniref:Phosphoglycerate mutase family protein-like protein n=1 Tax=Massariosphaeria phaeospora TaxID=100035 RepID=A0A7C8MMN2_9PLEO|nr:phosphoglycerate mutase family protein-like protein [Massariosphaeria phaeospora]
MSSPRVFIIRHGETEWSLNGRHTGTTELPLTAAGEKRIRATGAALVGDDRLIVPGNLACIYVSPRHRAQRTLELLALGCRDRYPFPTSSSSPPPSPSSSPTHPFRTTAPTHITPSIREWDYGSYEGLTSSQIRASRAARGLPPDWDIWRDGCEAGESPADVTARLDAFIAELREKWHVGRFGKDAGCGTEVPSDVLVVAHGHVLRALAARWIGKPLEGNPSLILEAGGVGTLSYEHHRVEEPAILLGGAFVVDALQKTA